MIRGHIDFASRTRVEGWMYSEAVPVAGIRVLAFIDDECVGEGVVDLYRHDLLQAGLGDGMAGFGFAVQLKDSHDPRVLDVRLEGGSVLVRQAQSRLVAREDAALAQRRAPRDLPLLAWLLARGFMTGEQHDILHRLARFGVHRQHLAYSVAERGYSGYLAELSQAAAAVFELHMHMDVTSDLREDLNAEDLVTVRDFLHQEFPAVPPVVALWAPRTNCFNLFEGSHLDLQADIADASVGVDYEFGDDHVLWINLDTRYHVPTGGMLAPLTAFFPARR